MMTTLFLITAAIWCAVSLILLLIIGDDYKPDYLTDTDLDDLIFLLQAFVNDQPNTGWEDTLQRLRNMKSERGKRRV